jgi:TonB family protein
VAEGDRTQVNARAFAYAKFFNAIKRQFNYYYQQGADNLRNQDIDQRVFAKNYITRFTVAIRSDGHLGGVSVVSSSGVTAFDDLVVNALRNASPFPTPPRELLDAAGRLVIPGECRMGVGMATPSFAP